MIQFLGVDPHQPKKNNVLMHTNLAILILIQKFLDPPLIVSDWLPDRELLILGCLINLQAGIGIHDLQMYRQKSQVCTDPHNTHRPKFKLFKRWYVIYQVFKCYYVFSGVTTSFQVLLRRFLVLLRRFLVLLRLINQ